MNDKEPVQKRDVHCVMCFSKFSSKRPELIPRNLNCTHIFCTGCLLKLQEYQGEILECPRCKVRSVLPVDSVSGLVKNYEVLFAAMDTNEGNQELCNFCIRKLVYPPRNVTLNCYDCGVLFCGQCCDEIHRQLEFKSHNVCLASAEINDSDTTSSQSSNYSTTSRNLSGRPMLKHYSSSLDLMPECEEHLGEKLKMYCSDCKTVCCTHCQIEGKHKGHKSFHIHEAEDIDKRKLRRLQQKVDEYGEKFIKSRSEVQRTIEDVKKNDICVKDLIRRYYRELRTAIDNGEKTILDEVGKRNQSTLRSLNEQLSSMIEISSQAKSISRRCEGVFNLNYFDMIGVKLEVEKDIEDVLDMDCKTTPCCSSCLQCQFPNHEMLLNQLRICAKIVAVPDAPIHLSCKIALELALVTVEWSPPPSNPYMYSIKEYSLQSDIGPENTFVDIYKGKSTKVMVDLQNGTVSGDVWCKAVSIEKYSKQVRLQFRVAAINIIGQSTWSSRTTIKLPEDSSDNGTVVMTTI